MQNIGINGLFYNIVKYITLTTDDVILISESERGLQNCLKKLEDYCDMWCLDININTTKTIIFNKSDKLLNYNFNFDGKSIENVHTRGYQKVLSLTWKEPEIWIYSALFFNVVPFQLHTLVPSSFPVINTRSVEVNILVP